MKQRRYYLVAAGVVAVVIGLMVALLAPRGHQPPSLPVAAASVTPSISASASPAAPAASGVTPTQIIIPAIGVNAPVEPVGLCPTTNPNEDCNGVESGGLATPLLSAQNLTGWWGGGAKPGANGAAVIVGHVDNPNPAVFWNLKNMVVGESIEIEPGNIWFTVVATQSVSKDAFPSQAVYGATAGPTLRLVTCTGDFRNGHYLNNFIVFAVLAHPSG